MPTIHNGNFQPVTDNLTRILENGDTRVTEISDIRITDNILFSGAESGIYANPSLIKFTTRVFYKINNVWKQGFFFVKNNGVWQAPSKMYRYINNFWKRVY
jgi:hypothetical protein